MDCRVGTSIEDIKVSACINDWVQKYTIWYIECHVDTRR